MDSLLSSSSYRFVGNGNVVSDIYLLRFLVLCFNVGRELVGLLVGVVDWETIVIDMNSEISPISCGNVCQMKK
ncbi:BnaA07g07910D [Brassica napus]|uniref:BnaA07g07910D protein n=2 Tax=Brassica TaxID=3705 RepID=A0A078I2N1_BRANA|nr:BnaA07g07910D [Brassica napus]VDC97097.1 unnamed protein product [Brassica rapa]